MHWTCIKHQKLSVNSGHMHANSIHIHASFIHIHASSIHIHASSVVPGFLRHSRFPEDKAEAEMFLEDIEYYILSISGKV
jgi:hypothetical protein